MTAVPPTSVRIGDGWPPALPDGTYTLAVTQAVTPGNDPEQTFSATYSLTVGGPRFAIAPTDLHSRFPAPSSLGSYATLLPQAVLARATLPWERALDGAALTAGALPTPFVALLVVSGDAPPVRPGTVDNLLSPPIGTLGPKVTLEPYEQGTDTCNYVDLPLQQYLTVMPTEHDLGWLAHLRQADTTAKALGEAPPDGWFAVVIANRFPTAGEPSTAYLVSLEGLQDYLPPAAPPAGTEAVRMAVLTSWSFTDDGQDAQAFSQRLDALGAGALAVTSGDAAADAVLAQGYVPMRHTTRQGETVTSLYRGPLVPLPLAPPATPPSYSCPDAALRFDPATGLLDVSYAAAWQLGRLLALGDREVAQAIFQWRRGQRQRLAQLAGRITLTRRFPSLDLGTGTGALLRGHAVRGAVARLLADGLPGLPGPALPVTTPPPATGARGRTAQPAAEHAATLRALHADPRGWAGLAAESDEPVPAVVAAWLGRLAQLDGLPFSLLVPDARALPEESIRFFFLDQGWLDALTDGALSVGRATSLDAAHDAAVTGLVAAAAAEVRDRVRAEALGLAAPATAGGAVSGFLLRSSAIASWRGVEIGVYADAARQEPLTLIRLDRVSDNVLLCLVDGALGAIRFTQPAEGIQFGVESAGGWSIGLRGLDVNGKPAGSDLGVAGTLVERAGLLDAADSAVSLAAQLTTAQAWTGGRPLTSGDFAVQLLEDGQIVDMVVTVARPQRAQPRPGMAALLDEGRAALNAAITRERAR
jgi:hypothetical protein